MPFFLDGNPTQGEISEAVNYLLSNFSQSVASDPNTGQIVGPGGEVVGYLYKYIFIKYADSFDGSVGFSNVPTNKGYYGIRNSDSSTESTNPVDYVWTQVTGGFGTTKFLYYLTTGGRQIQFQVDTAVPNPGWEIDPGTAIDLDFVTGASTSPANFVVIRIPNVSTAPTDAEVLSAIGRLPIDGDLCTVNYNSGIASIVYKYTTGWAVFQKYITGDLIVANSIVGTNIAASTITGTNIAGSTITGTNIAGSTITGTNIAGSTITGTNIAGNTITGSNIVGGTITADKLSASYIQVGGAASDVNAGVTTISGGKITASSITASQMAANSITAANAAIENAAVNTLQIAGSAVTFPAAATSSSTGANVTVSLTSGDRVYISGYTGSTTTIASSYTRTTTITVSGAASGTLATNTQVNPSDGISGIYPTAGPLMATYTAPSTGSYTFAMNYSPTGGGGATGIQVIGLKR